MSVAKQLFAVYFYDMLEGLFWGTCAEDACNACVQQYKRLGGNIDASVLDACPVGNML